MEPQYLNENLDSNKAMTSILDIAKKYIPKFNKDIATKKKRGGLNEITDLRGETAKMLKIPIEQVFGLTRNWSASQLRDTLKACNNFINPPALWWTLYKKNKTIYGRTNKKILLRNRKERWKENSTERQKTLF